MANEDTSCESTTESGPPRVATPRPDDQLSTTAAARYDFRQVMPQESLVALNKSTEGIPLFIVHPIEGKDFVNTFTYKVG